MEAGNADRALAYREVMIVAGIGCRAGAGADAIIDAVRLALRHCNIEPARLGALATATAKGAEPGMVDAARTLRLPLILVDDATLRRAASAALTVSARVLELKGVPSVAETAALSVAGRSARLLAPRLATAAVTCAIAQGEDA